MLLAGNKHKTIFGDRAYMQIFLTLFHNCDANYDNVLDFSEFRGCMGNDTYFKRVTPPPAEYSSSKNLTDPTGFYRNLFDALDVHKTDFINFHAYMELRLMIFSWKKCSVWRLLLRSPTGNAQ
jgi:hypothetical protein